MRQGMLSCVILLVGLASCFAQNSEQRVLDKRDLVTREWITEAGTNVRFLDHETVFNSDGKKVQETEYTRYGKLWTKKFEYGQDGKLSKELTYNDKGKLDSFRKFEYNEFGKKKTVYTYDAKGTLVKVKVIEYQFREHAD